ncbi:hypothetical protein HUO09_17095 [Vibrio sp. Y2-5]|uniref:hypothetical protein n=1 Tax=Vibrio sp. Y2-5 TaxID=2743977 RepID=UPI001661582B|nr:hypothetical protein [Vibrio sp. Y2-5]MBD0788073.1 hypothetical protein [Vibrio sp. Y2-5]
MKSLIVGIFIWLWVLIAIVMALPMFALCGLVGLSSEYTDLQKQLGDKLKTLVANL